MPGSLQAAQASAPRVATSSWYPKGTLAGVAGPGAKAAKALALGAFLLGLRGAKSRRYATKKRPVDAMNDPERKGKFKGSWLFPEMREEAFEEEDEPTKKKPLEDCVYSCWVTPKAKAVDFFKSWAEDETADDEQKDILLNLSSMELKKEWTVWGLINIDKMEAMEEKAQPGFYIVPPTDPDALVVVEAIDEETNNIQHLAVRPSKIGKDMRQAFLDWVDSLRPKVVIVKRPPELYAFGLGVDGDGKGTQMGEGPKVSKGL